jgi:hypothetical protein
MEIVRAKRFRCAVYTVVVLTAARVTRPHLNLVHVGDYLCCSSRTDVYSLIFQRDVGQVKRRLNTTDPELAKRRREIHRQKVERLSSDSAKHPPFAEYDAKTQELIGGWHKRWIEIAGGTMEASRRDRMFVVLGSNHWYNDNCGDHHGRDQYCRWLHREQRLIQRAPWF